VVLDVIVSTQHTFIQERFDSSGATGSASTGCVTPTLAAAATDDEDDDDDDDNRGDDDSGDDASFRDTGLGAPVAATAVRAVECAGSSTCKGGIKTTRLCCSI
jgi:hypothetical protein